MTLAPDHPGYHAPGEVDDPAPRVSVLPARPWKHLAQPPLDAPGLSDLGLARDIILAHLADGDANGDPWEVTWCHMVTDLHNPKAVRYLDAEELVACYHHWADLNGGTDWAPGDADELRTDITRHLARAGYTERN